jgi:hypothetical protein
MGDLDELARRSGSFAVQKERCGASLVSTMVVDYLVLEGTFD